MRLQKFSCLFSYHFDLSRISGKLIGRFQIKRQTLQLFVGNNPADGIQADAALSDFRVSVFIAGEIIHIVIDVNAADLFYADLPVQLVQNAVQVVYDIVSCGMKMARVDADSQIFTVIHPLDDLRDLVEIHFLFRPFLPEVSSGCRRL